jgi:8-oxo-dGTP diphosphatase
MLLLVRHAHAGDKSRWQGPDSLRPLSPAGQAEAAGLVVRLEDYPIERILSSPTVRCQQTVHPLASDCRLPIEPTPALAVTADPAVVLALLNDPRVQDAVLCTHGEVIARCWSGWPPTGWRSTSRWRGPRDRPGCCTAPTGGSRWPATYRRCR